MDEAIRITLFFFSQLVDLEQPSSAKSTLINEVKKIFKKKASVLNITCNIKGMKINLFGHTHLNTTYKTSQAN